MPKENIDRIISIQQQDPIKMKELSSELKDLNKELEVIANYYVNNKKIKDTIKETYPSIWNVFTRHDGLCDLLCNFFTLERFQVKPLNLDNFKKEKQQNNLNVEENKEESTPTPPSDNPLFALMSARRVDFNKEYSKKIADFDPEKIEALSKTHILFLYTLGEIGKYILTNEIPYSIFSAVEQNIIQKAANPQFNDLLNNKLTNIDTGSYIKFLGFKTNYLGKPTTGHSMLIVKLDETSYLFFNPDKKYPECDIFSQSDLVEKISKIGKNYSKLAFIDNIALMENKKVNLNFKNNEVIFKKKVQSKEEPGENQKAQFESKSLR